MQSNQQLQQIEYLRSSFESIPISQLSPRQVPQSPWPLYKLPALQVLVLYPFDQIYYVQNVPSLTTLTHMTDLTYLTALPLQSCCSTYNFCKFCCDCCLPGAVI